MRRLEQSTKLTETKAEFQLDIKIAIPRVIETLAHESSWVRGGAKDAMKTLAMQSKYPGRRISTY